MLERNRRSLDRIRVRSRLPRTSVLGHSQSVLSKLANKWGLMCSNPLIVRNRVNLKENRVGF
jgi:hypothetical protein